MIFCGNYQQIKRRHCATKSTENLKQTGDLYPNLKINMVFGRPRWADHLVSGVQDQPDQNGETPSLLIKYKISWAWWCMTIIPAIQEAEAGESPEPRR